MYAVLSEEISGFNIICIKWWVQHNLYIRLGPFLCADSKFTQQELPACKPLLTPAIVISLPSHHYCFVFRWMFAILSVRLISTFHEHRSFLPSYWLASYLSQLVWHRFLRHKRYIKICLYYVLKKYVRTTLCICFSIICCIYLVCHLTAM